ncbi:hypothetical protein HFC70_11500 [Agrobacterium sp. a22-2]|uniref:hypothetical protein n=1 Tax=Agrobacterium sp. a22-2 TaxID=2283840 RepID=UPI0014481BB7|nr:hypothetical protein [Agrobacterium sp. a22-2]NKN36980.1 hypothetical protein [Agrobacterium sp. a22-2]
MLAAFSASSLLGLGSAPEMDEDRLMAVFFQLHDAPPDPDGVEKMLEENGYVRVSSIVGDRQAIIEYADRKQLLFLIYELESYSSLAINIQSSVSLYETNEKFAEKLGNLMSVRMGFSPAPFEDDAGWQAVAWPGADGSSDVAFSVSHNTEHQVTRIWGHRLLVGDK